MNGRDELVSLVLDMLQRAGAREVGLVYFFLRALLREGVSDDE